MKSFCACLGLAWFICASAGELSVPVMSTDQVIPVLFAACNDRGEFTVELIDTNDSRPIYGIEAEVFDQRGLSLYRAHVRESYRPARSESVYVLLPPGSAYVRCRITGPELDGKWRGAKFEFEVEEPELKIAVDESRVSLTWDRSDCWVLECRTADGWWVPSPSVVPADRPAAFFRLRRL